MQKSKIIILITTTFMAFSCMTANAATKDGPEYSLNMDVEYATSTVLKNMKMTTSNNTVKTIDESYKMLLINGNLISDANIVTKNNRTLVPLRIISENTNAKIDWDDKARKVTIKKNSTNIELIIGKSDALINSKKVSLDVAPEIINNYTYLPIRFVSENMNCEVDYKDTKEGGTESFTNNKYPFFFPTIIVEEKTSEKFETSNKSLENLQSKLNSSLDDYKKLMSEVYDDNSVNNYISSLKIDIPKLTYSENIGRYYVFSGSAGTYLVNKYTNEMYIFRTSMNTRSIEKFEKVYPDIYYGLAN